MVEIILFALIFGLLGRHENKSIHGSPGLMAIVMILIGVCGYIGTTVLLVKKFDIYNIWLSYLSLFGWMGIGYGAYRFIQARREKAFYDRLNAE